MISFVVVDPCTRGDRALLSVTSKSQVDFMARWMCGGGTVHTTVE
jgi:hypothetical protein